MRPFRPALVLALAAILAAAAPARAFGPDGHRIVGDLAARQIAAGTAARVAALLAGEADASLAGVSIWADEVRERPEWRHTAPWHYVNLPRGDCRYLASRDCKDGRCIVAAIGEQAEILADRSRDPALRARALKFLVHFVADIHQPLHAGHADDRGGNTFQLFYLGQGGNLHALWDGGLLRASREPWRTRSARLAEVRADTDTRWSIRAPRAWAEASCRLIASADIYPRRPGRLPADYMERQLPVVERQLVLAGARLAALLDALLAD
ncbi:MAG: S1/P1 nuclease [Xanthomonadales bacterium]|nr:S1/P1 nuclease [Xanthomonadales bacterium]